MKPTLKDHEGRIEKLEKRPQPFIPDDTKSVITFFVTIVIISFIIGALWSALHNISQPHLTEAEITSATIDEIFERFGELECVEWEEICTFGCFEIDERWYCPPIFMVKDYCSKVCTSWTETATITREVNEDE